MSNMTIDEAVKRLNYVFPYLKPLSYVQFKSLFVFQMAKSDGSSMHFDNLVAVDRNTGLPFPFNPLKFGKEYSSVTDNFIDI